MNNAPLKLSRSLTLLTAVLCAAFFLYAFANPAAARDQILQGAFLQDFCEDAADTAQTIQCLNKELDFNQTQLNALYASIIESVSPDRAQEMQDIQSKWLAYRDSECAWEESWGEGEALARVFELHCMVQLTAQRLDRLSRAEIVNQDSQLPEFTPFPRWQTVLMQEQGGFYWKFSETVNFDTNCNGTLNHVIGGLATSEGINQTDSEAAPQDFTAVLGITHSRKTGRPDLFIVPLSWQTDEASARKCLKGLSLTALDEENEESNAATADDNANEAEDPHAKALKTCHFNIHFAHKDCPALTLEWNSGESFYSIKLPEDATLEADTETETQR